MGTSWLKRHGHETKEYQAALQKRYDAWKVKKIDSQGNWKTQPLKFGDSWNTQHNCWQNEIYRGEHTCKKECKEVVE